MYTPDEIAELGSQLRQAASNALQVVDSDAEGHLSFDEYNQRFQWTPDSEGYTKQDYEAALAGL